MSLVISDEILTASEMSEKEFLLEIAIMLFKQEKVSLAKASKIVGMNQIKFQTLLAHRGISIHYDVAEFKEDIEEFRKEGWL